MMETDRRIEDLLWVINSPSLVDDSASTCRPFPKLDRTDVDNSALRAFFRNQREHRVGLYFEQLVLFYLRHVRSFHVIANQLQIHADGRTIGELDFIYEDDQGTVTHLEAAVKFYMQLNRPHANGSRFVGPNSNDSFEIKTRRLLDHQLPLSSLHRPDVTRRIALVKGRIHYHIDDRGPLDPPPLLAADHQRGRWLHAAEIDRLPLQKDAEYRIMQKPAWLSPDRARPPTSAAELRLAVRRHFANSTRPLHICVTSGAIEHQRIFVLSDDWPSA